MAHAIEGYSRPQSGQTIQVKNQKKSTPASKPQTVKKISSNISGAVYTASRFEDVAKNKSTYTAKATYTNPVLAKKQSTITQVAQSNKEAAKTSPTALSAAKNFFGGMVDAGVSTAVSLYNLGRHPVETAKDLYNAAAHPMQTAKAIKEIAVELRNDFKEGNADVKAHMIGRAVGEIGLAFAGAKAVDIGAKALKTLKVAQATAKSGKAGVVAEKLSEASKAVSTAVNAAEEVADEAVAVGQVASKSRGVEVVNNGIKRVSQANLGIDELVVADKSFLDANGRIDWNKFAPNGGYVSGTKVEGVTLSIGKVIDRYGNPRGSYTSPVGVPYEQRSLPYIENPNAYHKYEVIKPIDNVSMGKIEKAFNQPGGGIQYELPNSINYLIKNGYLKEIK